MGRAIRSGIVVVAKKSLIGIAPRQDPRQPLTTLLSDRRPGEPQHFETNTHLLRQLFLRHWECVLSPPFSSRVPCGPRGFQVTPYHAKKVQGVGHGEWFTEWRRCLRLVVAGHRGGRDLQKKRQINIGPSSGSTHAAFSATRPSFSPSVSAYMLRTLVMVYLPASRPSIGGSLVIQRANRLSCALRPSRLSIRPSAATKARLPYAKKPRGGHGELFTEW